MHQRLCYILLWISLHVLAFALLDYTHCLCSRYVWLPDERLFDVSLPRLAAVGAVVAVWVTNKRKLASFVRHSLFPKWHVQYLTEWHWLKVYMCMCIYSVWVTASLVVSLPQLDPLY